MVWVVLKYLNNLLVFIKIRANSTNVLKYNMNNYLSESSYLKGDTSMHFSFSRGHCTTTQILHSYVCPVLCVHTAWNAVGP